MSVAVHLVDAADYTISLEHVKSVFQLKEEIRKATQIPPERQHLILHGKSLKDTDTNVHKFVNQEIILFDEELTADGQTYHLLPPHTEAMIGTVGKLMDEHVPAKMRGILNYSELLPLFLHGRFECLDEKLQDIARVLRQSFFPEGRARERPTDEDIECAVEDICKGLEVQIDGILENEKSSDPRTNIAVSLLNCVDLYLSDIFGIVFGNIQSSLDTPGMMMYNRSVLFLRQAFQLYDRIISGGIFGLFANLRRRPDNMPQYAYIHHVVAEMVIASIMPYVREEKVHVEQFIVRTPGSYPQARNFKRNMTIPMTATARR